MRYVAALFALLLSFQGWAIGETCRQIWAQGLTATSAVPNWASCFAANNSNCYNLNSISGLQNVSGWPSPANAGDYYINGNFTLANNASFAANGTTVRIFINGSLTIGTNTQLNWAGQTQNLLLVVTGSVTIRDSARVNGFMLVGGSTTIGNNVQIKGGLTSKGAVSTGSNLQLTYDERAMTALEGGIVCGLGLSCFNDEFQSGSLNSNDWVVSRSSGNFSPQVVGGRLRMTEAVGNQSTAASFQRLFPGDKNLVVVEFDHFAYKSFSGEGADGMAVVLSDATVTPQPGAFGGPLGYGIKPGIPGFAGGWLGVGLDEYGNYSAEGGPGSPGRRRQTVALRGSGSGSSGYRYIAGACSNGGTNTNGACLSPTVDNNNVSPAHRYRVTVDSRLAGQSMVKVERSTNGTFNTIINNFNVLSATGQAAVPANFILSVTGSTGGSVNVHEMDKLQICALNSQPVGEQIDHFEFAYTGQALTCKDETFTIKACKNAACTELVTGQVSATLTPSTGWVSGSGLVGNVLTFSGGTATATLRQNTPATVKVGVSGSTPLTKPLSTTLCQIGPSLSAANCDVVFSDSGLLFDVPNKLAAKPENGILVRAVKSDGTQQCVPSFANVSRVVRFWSDYVNPVVPAAIPAQAVTVTHSTTTRALGGSFAAGSDLTLDFNAQGQATISVNYADAGQLRLNARYTGSAANQDAGRVLNGADLFISYPAGLCLEAPMYCPAQNQTCTVMQKAGTPFNLTVSARAWQSDGDNNFCDNPTTPSFALNNVALSHAVLAPTPASGGINGTLSPTSYNHQAAASASTTVSASISEVGVFALGAGGSQNYLGIPLSLTSTMPAALGRLVPASFELVNPTITPGCGTFSYMGQNALLAFNLEARNQQGVVTQNYRGAFAKATAMLVAENNNDGMDRSSRLSGGTLLNWGAGSAVQTSFPVTFNRLPVATTPPTTALHDGPFQQLNIGMQVSDNDDNNTRLNGLDLLVTSANNCITDGNCTAKALAAPSLSAPRNWRYGRMVLLSVIGSEQSDLPVQVKAEYFNGSQFVPNIDDSCSPVDPTRLTAGTLSKTGTVGLLQNGISGPFDLRLQAPVPVSTKLLRYTLSYDLDSHPWLKYDWNPANTAVLENPTAEAVFGGHRGNNRQIFWREN